MGVFVFPITSKFCNIVILEFWVSRFIFFRNFEFSKFFNLICKDVKIVNGLQKLSKSDHWFWRYPTSRLTKSNFCDFFQLFLFYRKLYLGFKNYHLHSDLNNRLWFLENHLSLSIFQNLLSV